MIEHWATSAVQDFNHDGLLLRGVFRDGPHKQVVFCEIYGLPNSEVERVKKIMREESEYNFAIHTYAERFAIRPPHAGTRRQKLKLKKRWAYAIKLAHRQIDRSQYVHV